MNYNEKVKCILEMLGDNQSASCKDENDLYEKEWIKKRYDRTGEAIYTVSCPILASHINQKYNFVYVCSSKSKHHDVYKYNSNRGIYEHVYDDYIKGVIKRHIPIEIQRAKDIDDTYRLFRADDNIALMPVNEFNNNENIINFENGLLDIRDMVLRPHTPEELTTIQLPMKYDSSDTKCPVFDQFIDTLTRGDAKNIKVILQFMGLALSNYNISAHTKKALFFVGAGNTGKSQISMLLSMLLGSENTAATTLGKLQSNRFETSKLFCKRMVGDNDMSFSSLKEMSVFKQITGGDKLSGEFKSGALFDFVYKGLLLFCANDMPSFGGDKGKHVYERMVIIPCTNVIPEEKQDRKLIEKMYNERVAIVNKAITALIELINNSFKMTISEKSIEALNKYRTENSSAEMFIDECCKRRKSDDKNIDGITKAYLYRYYKLWCENNTYCPLSNQKFKKELINRYGKDITIKRQENEYYIFTLNEEHRRENFNHYNVS